MRASFFSAALAVAAAHGNHKHSHHHHEDFHASHGPLSALQLSAKPFDLSDYVLTPGSRFAYQQQRNLRYLTSYNVTDLLCQYTSSANLTGTYASPTCKFMDLNGYFGHYLGHYLSATAMLYQNTGDAQAKAFGDAVVSKLGDVQNAWTAAGERGYVFSYNTIAWDNLLSKAENCAPVCVPFYIYHKMLQGMLDQYQRAGNQQALTIMMGMVDWVIGRIGDSLAQGGMTLWQQVLGTEWGGMNDVLFKIYQLTNNVTIYNTAMLFNHWAWTSPFILGQDGLPNNHANTHIPEIIGDALGYELTGNATKAQIVNTFFYYLNSSHTFATGGSNDHEYWGQGNMLGDQMDDQTEESCTTYNILKLSRAMWTWNGAADTRWADFYDRALWNGIVGNQAYTGQWGDQSDTTGFIYMLPLGGGGLTKPWGDAGTYQPCCWGTLSETFSKLGDSVFFASTDDSTLFLNLYVPLTLTWKAKAGAVLTQVTSYPYDQTRTTQLQVTSSGNNGQAQTWTLSIRVPFWATNGNTVSVNGAPVPGPIPAGQYLNITRAWATGDVVDVLFPPSLRFEALNDQRQDVWGGVGAVLYGGILLAGVNTTQQGLLVNPNSTLTGQIWPDPSAPAGTLRFLAPVYADACGPSGNITTVNVTMMPLADVQFEQYTVYWHTRNQAPPVILYNGTQAVTLPMYGPNNLRATGGATLTSNGGDLNIRSGNPGETNVVFSSYLVQDPTGQHVLSGFNFTYRYVSGYGPAGAPGGTTFQLVLLPGCDTDPAHLPKPLAILYQSPVLDQYSFDACNTCYSPPIVATAPAGSMAVPVNGAGGARVALIFTDNQRNIQMDLPVAFTLYWGTA